MIFMRLKVLLFDTGTPTVFFWGKSDLLVDHVAHCDADFHSCSLDVVKVEVH